MTEETKRHKFDANPNLVGKFNVKIGDFVRLEVEDVREVGGYVKALTVDTVTLSTIHPVTKIHRKSRQRFEFARTYDLCDFNRYEIYPPMIEDDSKE